MTLWHCGRRIGCLGPVMTDQPWLLASVDYDDAAYAVTLESASHFLNVLVEEMPDFEDPEEDERHYFEVLESEGLTQQLLESFTRGPWEIRCGSEREEIQFHSLRHGNLQWRGPMGTAVQESTRKNSRRGSPGF